MKKILFLSVFFCSFLLQAQTSFWQKVKVNKEEVKESLAKVNLENSYTLNLEGLRSKLLKAPKKSFETNNLGEGVVVSFPNITGELENFRVIEVSNFSKELAEKYPSIKSYRGSSVENPSKRISISLSESRIKAIYFSEAKTSLIEPIAKKSKTYVVYDKNALSIKNDFECLTGSTENLPVQSRQTDDTTLRTFRLAVATDGEFTQYYFSNTQSILSAINDILNVVNPIYERDLAINLELISNTDDLFYPSPTTDPFTETGLDLNAEVQSAVTNEIGEANYDIGIMLSNRVSGGSAGCIACACTDGSKGGAYAGATIGSPEGYVYSLVVAHEMGHQLGANHTFSRSEGTGVNVETGSGVTIMSYAGITQLWNVQSTSSDFFLHTSIDQISNYIQSTGCATETSTTNQTPTVNAGSDYTIPSSTAFKLSATGSDPDPNDQLTYSWEQSDSNNTVNNTYLYPNPTSTSNPNFRVYNPTASPIQYFPPFEEVLNGRLYSTWNVTSTVSRILNFVVQVRDNSNLVGQTASDAMQVEVEGNSGPFQITSIDDYDGFAQGAQHNLTWDVNGTDGGNINTSDVKISISNDGGESFSTLIASTANDGQENITFPSQEIDKAFIMIEAIDNIFYTVSPSFAIGNDSTINCDEFMAQGPISLTNGFAEIEIDVPNSGIIEDLNVNIDVSGVNTEGILIVFGRMEDDEPTYLYVANCSGNSLDVKFNQGGESIFTNCGNSSGQSVEPIGDLSVYNGADMQGTWMIAVADVVGGNNNAVINSAGIEFCSRDIVDLSNEKVTQNSSVKLYPNPTNGEVRMSYKSTSGEDVEVGVFDLTGKRVFSKTANFTNASSTNLDLSALAAGVYLVKMNDGNQQFVKKLIVE
ncbi:zinc-dependent metalloprotease [Mesonia maritima]|uniref:Peptidase M12B domain-containing protein n=1 Tax=Mesonia maritima TaxID=1793873 RepID=A0ABU1KCA1_9FLAO|nr:M12 family metallo-peptidase [Mesonia maritima]MDR6302087.1 hypothetical protein [Mesonia maritima]